jgi:hypothetical protein
MYLNLPYSPIHSLEWLEKFFAKNYYKKPYDRFMWWRSYTPKSKPLHPRQPLLDRLRNGDFDLAPYQYEAEIVEHRLNQRWLEIGNDAGRYNEESSVDRARRKRLLEDFNKEEVRRLEELEKLFVQTFKMTKDQYQEEVLNTNLDNLVDFYFKMEEKYGTYWKPMIK